MAKLLNTDIARALFSVAGALVLSTSFVVAAVGPAKAAVPAAARAAPAAY